MDSTLLEALEERQQRGDAIGAGAVLDRVEAQLNGEKAIRLFRSDNRTMWPSRMPGPVVGLSVAAIVLLVGLASAVFLRFGFAAAEQPSAESVQQISTTAPTEQVSTTEGVSTTEPVVVVVPPPETTWERIDDDAFSPGAIWGVVSTGDVIVAVGEVSELTGQSIDTGDGRITGRNLDGVVWVSTNGYTWERIDDESVFGGQGAQLLGDVVSGPLGFVASGHEWPDAALWFSPDGYEWHKVLVDDLGTAGEPDGLVVVAGGPGWVAINLDWTKVASVAAIDDPGNLVFVSKDGLVWTKVEDAAAIDEFVTLVESAGKSDLIRELWEPGYYWKFTRDDERVVAVARDNSVNIQISDDSGVTWRRVNPEQVAFDEGWPRPQSLGVAFFGSQIIVGGNAQDDAAIWIGTWEKEQ